MAYQVYYEVWQVETTPIKWNNGIPTKYKYVENHYPQPLENFKTLQAAKNRAKQLRELRDINGRKYHKIKVISSKK